MINFRLRFKVFIPFFLKICIYVMTRQMLVAVQFKLMLKIIIISKQL